MSSAISQATDYARRGKTVEARRIAEANLSIHPDDAETWHLLGLLDNIEGSPATALERFRCAIELDPDVAKYHANFGNALRKTNHLGDAEQAYRRALRLDPDHHAAAFNLALLLHEQNRLNEALALLVPFADGRDASGETDRLLGRLYQDADQAQAAIACYRAALARSPERAETWARLAYLQELTNQVDEAQASVERGLALAPDLASLQVVRARLLRRAQRFEEAISTLAALPLASVSDAVAAAALNEWGTNLDRLGRTAEAMEKFVAAKQRQLRDLPKLVLRAGN